MTPLLEKLIELLREWFRAIVPWHVLDEDQLGLVLRLGRFQRLLQKGWNWKRPLTDEVKTCSGAIESSVLREQVLTTEDGRTVRLSGVIGYRVIDARKYILDCGDVEGVLNDIGLGVIGRVVPKCPYTEVMGDGERHASSKCLTRMRTKAEIWGIEVLTFDFADRYEVQAVRLLGVQVEP